MKSVKKLLALVLAIAVVATFALPVLAVEMTAAVKCETLKLLKGDGSGVTATYLAKTSTRLQSAIISLRLAGKEAEALAYTGTATFTDAADVTWQGGKNVLAYLKANPDLGWGGYPDGSFKPNAATTAQMFYKVMLEGLGYKQGTDFEWADVIGFAKAKGFAAAVNASPFTNDDMAAALVEALGMDVKGDAETTLLDKLVADGVIAKADAVAAGLMAADPAFGVKEIIANYSLKQFQVVFHYAVDPATITAATVTLTGGVVANRALSADNKTLTVQLNDLAAQNASLTLTLNGVKNADGSATINANNTTFAITDTVGPSVVSVVPTSSKTFVVTFTEPITQASGLSKVWDEIKVDGNKAVGAFAVSGTDENVWTFTLNSKLSAGAHTVLVSGFKDSLNYVIPNYDGSITIVADTAAPSVTSVQVLGLDKVIVNFNEPVIAAGTLTINGQVFVPTAGASSTLVLVAGKLDLASTYGETVTYSGITDNEGNVSANNLTFGFTAPADQTKPTASAVLNADNTLTVTFSERCSGLGTAANFSLLNADDTVNTAAADAITDVTDTSCKVKFNAIVNAPGVDATAFKLKIVGVKDTSVFENVITDYTQQFTTNDTKAPALNGAPTMVSGKVRVLFSEAMSAASLTNLNNYLYDIDGDGGSQMLSSIADASVSVAADGKSVDITVTGAGAGDLVRFLALTDVGGKRIIDADFNTDKAVVAPSAFDHTDIDTVLATGTKTVEITLKAGNAFATVDPNGFVIKDAADPSATIYVTNAVIDPTNAKKVTLTLNTALTGDAKSGASAVSVYVAGAAITDAYGQALVIATPNAIAVVDKIVPAVTVAAGDNKLTLTFSEAVNGVDATTVINDIVLKKAGVAQTIVAGQLAYTGGAGIVTNFTILTINGLDDATDYTIEVLSRNIKDLNANLTPGLAATAVKTE